MPFADMNIPALESRLGILAMAVGIYISITTRRKALNESEKAHNEATESLTRAAKNIVDSTQHEMERLRVEDILHEGYINYLLEGIYNLQQQLKAHDIKPTFNPVPIRIFLDNKKDPN
jgi:hypothetical protein